MTYKFTKLGVVNALWALIPIFPAWTIFPAIIIAELIKGQFLACEASYTLVLFIAISLTFFIVINFLGNLDYHLTKNKVALKKYFRLVNLALYTLVNTGALILIVGVDLTCNGDGQTLLAFIYSGPIASLSLVLFGFVTDLRTNYHDQT